MTLDCASPPPPLPPPPPPASPDEPRVCWAWGDPHIIPFDGAQYDAHGLGVRTLAAWDADQSVQIYSCPVRCEAGTAEWFPCGASSAVAISASIAGMAVSLVGDTVYVAGTILSPPLSAAGESRTVSCPLCPSNGLLTIRRLADDDPDYKTPGAKIQLTFGEGAAGGDARALKLWTRLCNSCECSLPVAAPSARCCLCSLLPALAAPNGRCSLRPPLPALKCPEQSPLLDPHPFMEQPYASHRGSSPSRTCRRVTSTTSASAYPPALMLRAAALAGCAPRRVRGLAPLRLRLPTPTSRRGTNRRQPSSRASTHSASPLAASTTRRRARRRSVRAAVSRSTPRVARVPDSLALTPTALFSPVSPTFARCVPCPCPCTVLPTRALESCAACASNSMKEPCADPSSRLVCSLRSGRSNRTLLLADRRCRRRRRARRRNHRPGWPRRWLSSLQWRHDHVSRRHTTQPHG